MLLLKLEIRRDAALALGKVSGQMPTAESVVLEFLGQAESDMPGTLDIHSFSRVYLMPGESAACCS